MKKKIKFKKFSKNSLQYKKLTKNQMSTPVTSKGKKCFLKLKTTRNASKKNIKKFGLINTQK